MVQDEKLQREVQIQEGALSDAKQQCEQVKCESNSLKQPEVIIIE